MDRRDESPTMTVKERSMTDNMMDVKLALRYTLPIPTVSQQVLGWGKDCDPEVRQVLAGMALPSFDPFVQA